MIQFHLFHLLHAVIIIGLILGSGIIILKYYFQLKQHNLVHVSPSRSDEQKIILPLRLQACERIILFLERISPNAIVIRLNTPEMTVIQLQTLLIKTIREEFEYNLSQQLYLLPATWELVKNAKEEAIKLINISSGKINESSSSGELVRIVLEEVLKMEHQPISIALDAVKKEIQKIF